MTQPSDAERPTIAAAVIVYQGKVLLVRRRVAEGSLSWQLPAGVVEEGESVEEAATRETAEETTAVVSAIATLGERVHPVTGRLMAYVACDFHDGELSVGDPDELAAVGWFGRNALIDLIPQGFYAPVQKYIDARLAD